MLIGQTNQVKFRVNVMGTSAEATVRVVLCTIPQLSFSAQKTGEEWVAQVSIPESVPPGDYDMKVEVIVGNRHFTPLTKRVELLGAAVEMAPVEEQKQPVEEAPVEEVPAEEVAAEVPVEEVPVDPLKTASLLRAITAIGAVNGSVVPATPTSPAPAASDEIVSTKPPVKKMILPKDFFKFEAKKIEPVEIKFKPIGSMLTHSVIDKPLKMESVAPVLELNHGTPIRLIKGEIIYE